MTTTQIPAWKRVRFGNPRALELRSQVGFVVDEREGVILYARDADKRRPIASLTKLLTVMTLLDAKLSAQKVIEVTRKDRDRLKGSRSSLRYGTTLTRGELMRIALVASDNRATAALARTYPGGSEALVRVVNEKARILGLSETRVADASGLRPDNVSTGRDLARLAYIARDYSSISDWSTTKRFSVVDRSSGRELTFRNTNSLVHRERWDIALSKTGFTSEAGNCLLIRTTIADRPLIVVLLNSWGKLSKYGDSGRIRDWIVASEPWARGYNSCPGMPIDRGSRWRFSPVTFARIPLGRRVRLAPCCFFFSGWAPQRRPMKPLQRKSSGRYSIRNST
jgi:D-alanyl-D-alanine endopeptidase (penicillin-binding protein 7)